MIYLILFYCITICSFSNSLIGDWKGQIEVSGVVLKIGVHFNQDKESKLNGTLDIVSQNANGIILEDFILDQSNISFKMKGVPRNPTFTGVLKNHKISGQYSQGLAKGVFELERGTLSQDLRPQTPKPPFSYDIHEVYFKGETDILSGTLTTPLVGTKHPVVILVSGSGPQDRDETILNHKPFAVISDFLTKLGIAVLRYDDRGVAKSKGVFATANTFNFAKDTKGAIDYLLKREDIDHSKIGVIGHSEGATIANIVAAEKDSKVSFIVMMAGIGVNGHKVLSYQRKQLHLNQGISLKAYEANEKIFDAALPLIQAKVVEKQFLSQLMPLALKYVEVFKQELDQEIDATKYLSSIYQALSSPWMRSFLVLDPAVYIKLIQQPTLVMNGTLDQQVDIALNIPTIKKSFKQANNTLVKYEMIDGVNHLFQTAPTGAVTEYSLIEETISPKVLKLLGNWIQKQTK